jgi:hypothetical protein
MGLDDDDATRREGPASLISGWLAEHDEVLP